MRCNICGSYTHEATTAGCPGEIRYIPQHEVVEKFTNPDMPTPEKQIIDILNAVLYELRAIRQLLIELPPPL